MNLFAQLDVDPTYEELFPGAVLMRGLALPQDTEFLKAVETITSLVPFHQMVTPGGQQMSVFGSDCGNSLRANAFSGADGRRTLPLIPRVLNEFAIRCAVRAGFPSFKPDSCHINRYQAGTRLGLHQDRHECDLTQPIVSVSFGLEAVFLLGGFKRSDKPRRILLEHGDVIVWGGPSRMRFHGVTPVKLGSHPLTGPYRLNLTFRKVG